MKNFKATKLRTIVIGAGNFGTALAQHLADKGENVDIWARSKEVAESINSFSKNSKYLTEINLNKNLRAKTGSDYFASEKYDVYVLAIPTQYLRETVKKFAKFISEQSIIVCASKGIEVSTLKMPISIVTEIAPQINSNNIAVLSGPSFAIEVAKGSPTSVSIGCSNNSVAIKVQELFHSSTFRAYTCDDPIGLEVAGAIKNVIALASGAARGMGLEHNAWAALLTRGLAEMTRLGMALGANPITFNGLGGVGDLFLTCTSEKSRNYRVGFQLGQGFELKQVVANLGSVAEGVTTTQSAYELGKKLDVDTPITKAVYEVLYEKKPLNLAVAELLSREKKAEVTYP